MAISVKRFGKDHWSTFGYIETVCVDDKKGIGTIDHRRMRCNTKTHPLLAHLPEWDTKYGTRLKGYFEYRDKHKYILPEHDDWDCLDDLETAGLLEILSTINGLIILTDKGNKVAGRLRTHKAEGGCFADFSI